MEKVISGIRPTGNLHLGNYFGAVKSFVKMQEEYNCMFFIADWHSLTTHPTPENIRTSVRTILAEYLACGIFGVAWLMECTEETDVQTWFAADPTITGKDAGWSKKC